MDVLSREVAIDMLKKMRESELAIDFAFDGGPTIRGVIDRVLGPLLIEEIKHRLPVEGKAAFRDGEMKITLGIGMGNLKATRQVKRGQIAYMPLGDSLNIYLKDMNTFSQVNVLGRVVSSDEVLDAMSEVKRGARVTIQLVN
jgi:hypothetical protein